MNETRELKVDRLWPARWRVSLDRRRLVYIRDLLVTLVARDIKVRYKGSVLGIAWSLLNPLAQLLVLNLVFQHILPLGIPNYTVFLFTGLLAWNWFQTSLFSGSAAIVDGRSLIKRPGFPAALLPVVIVTSNLIHFLLALPVLFAFLFLLGIPLHPTVLLLPVVIALQFVLTLALSFFAATAHVAFRDTQYLVGVFLMLFFYLTPIFYDPSAIPASIQGLYRLNPMLHLLEAYRTILIDGQWPNWQALGLLALFSGFLLVWGYRVFMRASYSFVEEL